MHVLHSLWHNLAPQAKPEIVNLQGNQIACCRHCRPNNAAGFVTIPDFFIMQTVQSGTEPEAEE